MVIGDHEALRPWAERAALRLVAVDRIEAVPGAVAVLDPGGTAEPVELASLRRAVAACLAGQAAAVVTGPIHKARLARRGFHHPGHTEFLAELCGTTDPVMAFVGGRVRVALVTVHLPLSQVPSVLTPGGVLHTIQAADQALRQQLGLPSPRIVVCGLNPHAGDEGLLGHEDAAVVAPAVAEAVAGGIGAYGPVSVEAAFRAAVLGQADLVVAMYHDQGLAPLKALEWALPDEPRAVNWTLGLPVVRCGVDHGTADDIAGQGIADPGSMRAALALATRLALDS